MWQEAYFCVIDLIITGYTILCYAVACDLNKAKSLLKKERTQHHFFILAASLSLHFFVPSSNRPPWLLERGLHSAARLSAVQSLILSPAAMIIAD